MKKRIFELLIVYFVYLTAILIYAHYKQGSVLRALSSFYIWLMPLIVVLPTHFIAFIISVAWPQDSPETDTRIYRFTHLGVLLLIVIWIAVASR
ncbi:hypothetical protein [Chitinophaga nivalis]|uniref:Uncharacterized protein n=1 Tax=Chitinophaga nivalis TaxID=2991709 RepID=A0ABT3IVJ4_9BACT|nr:hypothetical protein [Chitinophaga nivalis]MCW3462604.1 hypothetical protein [Chitinophaga nivalis]MCW3487705.1 hypothetical protein [Chitinophaga nivalis]